MSHEKFTPQQYRKFNGQSIMLALETMGGSATSDDLTEHIATEIDQPKEIVKPEVNQVLRRGIANGFFQRRGTKYSLFNEGNLIEVDGSKRKRKTVLLQTDGSGKRIRFSRPADDDDDLRSELDGENMGGLQQIIAKANEETQNAAMVASRAAKRAKFASIKIQEMIKQ